MNGINSLRTIVILLALLALPTATLAHGPCGREGCFCGDLSCNCSLIACTCGCSNKCPQWHNCQNRPCGDNRVCRCIPRQELNPQCRDGFCNNSCDSNPNSPCTCGYYCGKYAIVCNYCPSSPCETACSGSALSFVCDCSSDGRQNCETGALPRADGNPICLHQYYCSRNPDPPTSHYPYMCSQDADLCRCIGTGCTEYNEQGELRRCGTYCSATSQWKARKCGALEWGMLDYWRWFQVGGVKNCNCEPEKGLPESCYILFYVDWSGGWQPEVRGCAGVCKQAESPERWLCE